MRDHDKAAFWMVFWVVSFSIAMLGNKWVKDFFLFPMIVWSRSFFGLLLLVPFASQIKKTHLIKWQLLRGLLISCAMLCSYSAYRYLPVHTAAILGTSGPIFTVLLSILVLKERITVSRWLGMILGYTGVLIVVLQKNTSEPYGFSFFEIVAVAGNLCTSCAMLVGKYLAEGGEDKTTTLFYNALIPFLCFSIAVPFYWSPPTGTQWLVLVLMGCFGAISQLCTFSALKLAKVSFIAPFEYLRLCVMIPLGYLIFKEAPNFSFYIGAPLIILSSFWLTFLERKLPTMS